MFSLCGRHGSVRLYTDSWADMNRLATSQMPERRGIRKRRGEKESWARITWIDIWERAHSVKILAPSGVNTY